MNEKPFNVAPGRHPEEALARLPLSVLTPGVEKDPDFVAWVREGARLYRELSSLLWEIADWCARGEKWTRKSYAAAAAVLERTEQGVRDLAFVARAFPPHYRVPEASFSAHRAAASFIDKLGMDHVWATLKSCKSKRETRRQLEADYRHSEVGRAKACAERTAIGTLKRDIGKMLKAPLKGDAYPNMKSLVKSAIDKERSVKALVESAEQSERIPACYYALWLPELDEADFKHLESLVKSLGGTMSMFGASGTEPSDE